ncbi:hypothetical protein BV912_01340 [Neisseria dumasiana]|uniref:Uncharacterized protein n=1 Tax=Neisseria dumasiana TaxID=1931275 RepID=A0A1X3DL77_9NEIS|nr:hypothetical protein BV912_01340 [Neisseria dumasiana]
MMISNKVELIGSIKIIMTKVFIAVLIPIEQIENNINILLEQLQKCAICKAARTLALFFVKSLTP